MCLTKSSFHRLRARSHILFSTARTFAPRPKLEITATLVFPARSFVAPTPSKESFEIIRQETLKSSSVNDASKHGENAKLQCIKVSCSHRNDLYTKASHQSLPRRHGLPSRMIYQIGISALTNQQVWYSSRVPLSDGSASASWNTGSCY